METSSVSLVAALSRVANFDTRKGYIISNSAAGVACVVTVVGLVAHAGLKLAALAGRKLAALAGRKLVALACLKLAGEAGLAYGEIQGEVGSLRLPERASIRGTPSANKKQIKSRE